jgi:hypothetical protein
MGTIMNILCFTVRAIRMLYCDLSRILCGCWAYVSAAPMHALQLQVGASSMTLLWQPRQHREMQVSAKS